MPGMGRKAKRVAPLTVGEFFEHFADELQLSLLSSETGFDREIKEPTINRPGLALAGFFTYFAYRRYRAGGN